MTDLEPTKISGSLSGRLGVREEPAATKDTPDNPRRAMTIAAMVTLLAAMVGLVADSGGIMMVYTPYVAVLLLPGVWPLLREFQRWSLTVRISASVLVGWTLVSFLYAPVHSSFPGPMLIMFGLFPVAASASYLMRHRRKHLAAVFVVTGVVWLFISFKSWLVVLAPNQPRLLRTVGWQNPTAAFFGMLALCALGVALRYTRRIHQLIGSLCFGLGAGLVLLTHSRGGTAVFLATTVLLVVALRPRLINLAATTATSLATTAITYGIFLVIAPAAKIGGAAPAGEVDPTLGGHLASASGDFGLRVQYWRTAVKILVEHPMFGTGSGSWVDVVWRYMGPTEDWSTATHNWYLQTFAEEGLIAGIALVVLVAAVSVASWRLLRNREASALGRGAAAGVLMLTAYNFIDFNNRWPVVMWMLAMLAGIVAGASKQRPLKETGRILSSMSLLALAALFSIGFFFGVQGSTLLPGIFGLGTPHNIRTALAADYTLMNYKVHGKVEPQYREAYNILTESLHWNPGEPRLELMRNIVLFDADPSENTVNYITLYALVHHQILNPWPQSYGFVSLALANRAISMEANKNPTENDKRTVAYLWLYDFKTTQDGVATLTNNPGWDPGYIERGNLLARQIQASNALRPCGIKQLAAIKGLQEVVTNGALSARKDAQNMLHQIAKPASQGGCPKLAAAAGLK